jgi:hypothetical protein
MDKVMTHFHMATTKLKLLSSTKMISTPIKTAEHAEWNTPIYAKSISLLDIGLSIREVAKRCGISQSIVSRFKDFREACQMYTCEKIFFSL